MTAVSGIRITATPSLAAPIPVAPAGATPIVTGEVIRAPEANTYTHNSYVFYKSERFLFTLNVPLLNSRDSLDQAEKAALDHEINVFKTTFLNHLTEQKNGKIQPGKDFSVSFDPNVGYTACPGPTLIPNSAEALTVCTPEAIQLSKAISAGKAEDIKRELSDSRLTKYRPPAPPESAPAAASKSSTPAATSQPAAAPVPPPQDRSETASISSEHSHLTEQNLARHNSIQSNPSVDSRPPSVEERTFEDVLSSPAAQPLIEEVSSEPESILSFNTAISADAAPFPDPDTASIQSE